MSYPTPHLTWRTHDVLPTPSPHTQRPMYLTHPPPHPLPSEIYGVFPDPPPPPTIGDSWCLFRPSHLPLENHDVFADPPHLHSETHGVFPDPPRPPPTIRDPWCLSRPPPHLPSEPPPPSTIRDPWCLSGSPHLPSETHGVFP